MKLHRLPLIALPLLFFGADARGQTALEKIVITYPSRSIASVDLYIAQERGFFRQEGLLADVVQVRGNIGVTALLSGDAHAMSASTSAHPAKAAAHCRRLTAVPSPWPCRSRARRSPRR